MILPSCDANIWIPGLSGRAVVNWGVCSCSVQSCKGGRVQQVEQLIFYGADINQQNAGGNTALHVCAANNQVCVCRRNITIVRIT